MAETVFLVTGFDVGGNTGFTIEAAFTRREDAEAYALRSKERGWNSSFSFWCNGVGEPFEIEEVSLLSSLSECADTLLPSDHEAANPEWRAPRNWYGWDRA